MRAIDTNVLARFVMEDDPDQSHVARRSVAGGVFVTWTVLLEFGRLLGSRYQFPRDAAASILRMVAETETIRFADPVAVGWVIDRFAAGADLADMIHLVGSADCEDFATFDRDVARRAGADAPVAIETLR